MEPSLNPPTDEKFERISDYVDNLTIEDLAVEIYGYGLDEKVKETIIKIEIPISNDFVLDVIQNSNLEFLLKLISKTTMFDVKEIIIDYLYWKDESWDS